MSDPRWGDVRDRDRRELDDGRGRVHDERDRAYRDPREGLMRDLDRPRGEARELVVDRDRTYELNGEDSRTLVTVGAFRVVPERDLGPVQDDGPDHDTLEHLRDEGLIRTVALGDDEQAVALTREGRDLLDANSREPDEGDPQAFYAGVSRPREIDHDAHLYAAYREEEARLRQAHEHVEIRRIVLEQDLKREYQEFLQEHNRDRSDSDGRPDRREEEIRGWAQDHGLPYVDDRVQFPDFRIEYDVDGRESSPIGHDSNAPTRSRVAIALAARSNRCAPRWRAPRLSDAASSRPGSLGSGVHRGDRGVHVSVARLVD